MNYCDQCGTALEVLNPNLEWRCPACQRNIYANPVPTIDAMLFDEDGRILIGARKNEPSKGKLNLPGGFVDMNETLEQAIARELKEELDLDATDYSKLTYVSSRVDKYNYAGKERQLIPVIMVGDIAHRDFGPNEEVTEYFWKLPSELKPDELTNHTEYDHIMEAARFKQKL